MAQLINIKVKVLVNVRPDDEAGVFVSHCPVLNVYSQGESEEEAKEAIQEAIQLKLAIAYRFDRLHQILTRSGFSRMVGQISDLPSEPIQYVSVMAIPDKSKQFEIEVPMALVAAAAQNPG